MIRDARSSDYAALDRIFRIAHGQSPFRDVPYNEQHARRMLALAATMPVFFCQVVEHNGDLVGVLAGIVEKNVFGAKVATDLISYSKRDTDKLIRNFADWAKAHGAVLMVMTDISGNKRYRQLLKGVGLNETGASYSRVF